MSNSPNLKLPFIDANQNQKSVTHNAALTILDALVNLNVQSTALQSPPAILVDGQCWIVASGGTGAWAGKDLNVASWQDGAWAFYAPNRGVVAYVDSLGGALMWNGTAWVSLLGAITQLSLQQIGLGTTVDSANPFSAKLNSALFAAAPTGAGGTGHVRVALSKQASANTASLLFEDAASARAELGLIGDDNLHLKVSPDGSTFVDAMVVGAANGAVAFLSPPTFPSPAPADNTTKAATTGFVGTAVSAAFARSQVADAAYAIQASDRLVAVIALTAARVLTLPPANAYPAGATLTVADESGACSPTNTITLARTGSDTVNGAASAVLALPYGYLALESNGANKWTVIDQIQTAGTTPLATVAQGAAGSTIQFGTLEQLVALSGSSTVSSIQIPNRAIVFAVSCRTVTAVAGAPSYGVGVAGNATQFGGSLGAAAGSTNSGVIGPTAFYSPASVVITPTSGSFTGGSVRIAVHYMLCGAPTA